MLKIEEDLWNLLIEVKALRIALELIGLKDNVK